MIQELLLPRCDDETMSRLCCCCFLFAFLSSLAATVLMEVLLFFSAEPPARAGRQPHRKAAPTAVAKSDVRVISHYATHTAVTAQWHQASSQVPIAVWLTNWITQ